MRVLITVLSAILILSAIILPSPVRSLADEQKEWETARRLIEPEVVPVPEDLRLRENFDSSRHSGLILSQASLNRLWSAVVSTNAPYKSRLGIGIPDPPAVDFDKYSLIWFADRQENPGIVDSITVAAYDSDKSIIITIVESHQDSGSQAINFWKIPKTDYSPEFNILHK